MRRKAPGSYGHLDPSEEGVRRWFLRQRTGVVLPVLVILAVFLILGGIRAWTTGSGGVDDSGVASFMWRDIAPELSSLINQVRHPPRSIGSTRGYGSPPNGVPADERVVAQSLG